MSFDIESGNSHKCECGAIWYDSDGGCDACIDIAETKEVDELLDEDCLDESAEDVEYYRQRNEYLKEKRKEIVREFYKKAGIK